MFSIFGTSDALLRKAQDLIQKKQFQQALDLLESKKQTSKNHHIELFIAKLQHAMQNSHVALERIKEINLDPNLSNLNQALIHYDQNNYQEAYTAIDKMDANNYHKKPFLNWVKHLVADPKPSASSYKDAISLRFTSLDIQARAILTLEEFMPIEVMCRASEDALPFEFNPLFLKSERIKKKQLDQAKIHDQALQALEENDIDLAIHLHAELSLLPIDSKKNNDLLKKIAKTKLNSNTEALSQEEKIYYLLVTENYKTITSEYQAQNTQDQDAIEMLAFAYFSQGEFKQAIQLFENTPTNNLSTIATLYFGLAYHHDKKLAHALETIKSFLIKEPSSYANTIFTFFTTIYPQTTFPYEYN